MIRQIFEVKIDNTLCRLCENCIENCPTNSLFIEFDELGWDTETCSRDGYCEEICIHEAIKGEFKVIK